jgi:ADP-ribose pyrophosphatase
MVDLTEKKISTEIIYQGRLLDVRKDKVLLPNGKSSIREWINHPGAVCLIPILPDGRIALVKQYRYPVLDHMIELPAGKIDKKETPLECAKRELEEEIGYQAKKITFISNIHPAVGFANEKMWIYLAEDLEKTTSKLDEDEFLEFFPVQPEEAISMIWEGKITDVKTMIGLLWFEKISKER